MTDSTPDGNAPSVLARELAAEYEFAEAVIANTLNNISRDRQDSDVPHSLEEDARFIIDDLIASFNRDAEEIGD